MCLRSLHRRQTNMTWKFIDSRDLCVAIFNWLIAFFHYILRIFIATGLLALYSANLSVFR